MSNATKNNNRTHTVTRDNYRLLTISRSPSTVTILRQQLSSLPGIAVMRSGFTGVGGVLVSENLDNVSNVLLSLKIDSFRLSATRQNFSFRRSTPLSVHVDGANHDTTSIIGACSRTTLTSVLCHCKRRGFDHHVTTGVMGTQRRGPVRAAFRLISVVGTDVPRQTVHSNRPTQHSFRTVHVRIGNRLSMLRRTLRSTFSYLGPNNQLMVVAFRSLRSQVIGGTFTR